MEILTVREIGRHTKFGRPLPYPSPLPAYLRDGHLRAARRYFRLFCASIWLIMVGFMGALLARWFPQLLPIFVAAIVVGIVASVLWMRGVSRHRAVLARYGVETDDKGKPVLTPSQIAARQRQKAEGLELRTEASRALRWYWLISAVGLVTTVGWAAFMSHEIDQFNRVESPWWIHGAVYVVCFTVLGGAVRGLHVIMERVALAGGPQDPKERHGGWVLVAVAVLCIAAATAIQVDRIADEPAVTVSTYVTCYPKGCHAGWDYDGHSYVEPVSSSLEEGPQQIEISADHPYVEISGQDTLLTRYSVWVVAPVALVGGFRWLSRSIALTRRLRRTARGAGVSPAVGPTAPGHP